jgi:hypothetical protein
VFQSQESLVERVRPTAARLQHLFTPELGQNDRVVVGRQERARLAMEILDAVFLLGVRTGKRMLGSRIRLSLPRTVTTVDFGEDRQVVLRLVGARLEPLEMGADRLHLVRRAVHAVAADHHDIAAQVHAGQGGADIRIQSDALALEVRFERLDERRNDCVPAATFDDDLHFAGDHSVAVVADRDVPRSGTKSSGLPLSAFVICASLASTGRLSAPTTFFQSMMSILRVSFC